MTNMLVICCLSEGAFHASGTLRQRAVTLIRLTHIESFVLAEGAFILEIELCISPVPELDRARIVLECLP